MTKLILSTVLFFTTAVVVAQVGIGTANPDTSAELEIYSTIKGFLPPRIADETTIVNPASGLLIYNTTLHCLQVNLGTPVAANWQCLGAATPPSGPTPVYCSGTATIISDLPGTGGRVWMDRNLGASQQANAFDDANAYGDLYQWGRFADGHQCRTSGTTTTVANSADPGHDDFILSNVMVSSNWTDFAEEDSLWQNGLNDPCPSGYRVPTIFELVAEGDNFSPGGAAGAFTTLKMTNGGVRNATGAVVNTESGGYYWSSTISTTSALHLFNNGPGPGASSAQFGASRHTGISVRCIKK